jgi:hypothetical protein
MTSVRKNSADRNAPRCTIGNYGSTTKIEMPTPGPNDYNNLKNSIGDVQGVHIPFTTAPRPISA